MSQFEQRANIKFMCRLGKSATETLQALIQVYGDSALKKSAVFDWFNRFKNGQDSVEDEPRSGRPSSSTTPENVKAVNDLVRKDRRITIHEVATEVGISFGSAQAILVNQLGMRRVCSKFVPHNLNEDQRECRMDTASDLFQRSCADPQFMDQIVTGDETWVYAYDPETKQQSSEWHTPASPRPKKSRFVKSHTKVMLIVFFDKLGIVHHEFVPPGNTVNKTFYVQVLKRLREKVRRKRPEKFRNGWTIHHDNAPCHKALVVQEFLARHQIALLPQSPYSPDLAPCDFWLFNKLKMGLRGKRFASIEDIEANATAGLRSIPKEQFALAFQEWQNRWNKCVCAHGQYFEGD